MVIRINCLRELLTEILYITLFLEDFFLSFMYVFVIYWWNVFMEFSNEYVKVKSSPELFFKRSCKIFQENICATVTLLKRRPRHRCFLVNFAKFLRTLFLYRTPLVFASVKFTAECLIRRNTTDTPAVFNKI